VRFPKTTILAFVVATLHGSTTFGQEGNLPSYQNTQPVQSAQRSTWVNDNSAGYAQQPNVLAIDNGYYPQDGYQGQQVSAAEAAGLPAEQTSLLGNESIQAQMANGGGGYESCGGEGCGECGDCCDTCIPFWQHRSGVYADFLYLQARGVDTAYALPRDGVDPATSVPFGGVGTADPDYQPGIRFGVNHALDACSSIGASYTWYESTTNGEINTQAPLVIHSLVTHPGTASAAADSLVANTSYDIDFDLIDVDYRRLLSGGRNHAINYLVGARYGRLEQNFRSGQPISPGTTSVFTDLDFEGAGPRFGLEGERKAECSGFMVYGRTYASFLAGDIQSDYIQENTFAQTQVTTGWNDSRVIPILEYEVGAGWQNHDGTIRVSGGYYMAGWFNMLTNRDYIQAVQTNDYVERYETVTFDGLTARIEFRR
jgi:hypothetical protein